VVWNEEDMSSPSDEKCQGNVEWGERKEICNRYAKGGRKKQKEMKLKEAWQRQVKKFIYKQTMKYDMTKSQRNFASAAGPWLSQRQEVTASKCGLVLSSSSLPRQRWQRDRAKH